MRPRGGQKGGLNSMYDFASRIAAAEKLPSLVFLHKPSPPRQNARNVPLAERPTLSLRFLISSVMQRNAIRRHDAQYAGVRTHPIDVSQTLPEDHAVVANVKLGTGALRKKTIASVDRATKLTARGETQSKVTQASRNHEADPAHPHRNAPASDHDWPAHVNSREVEQRH